MMKPTDEELEAMANRFARLAKTMRQMKAASVEAYELDNVATLLRACKGNARDAGPELEKILQAAFEAWWKESHDFTFNPDGMYEAHAKRSFSAGYIAALEQEPRHE